MSFQMPFNQYDFSGGMNNRDSNALLKDNESPDMRNMVLGKRGTFETAPGVVLFRQVPVDDVNVPVTGLYEYITQAGEEYFLAYAGGKLKKAITGNWQLIKDEFTDGTYPEFVTHSIVDKALFVNGKDGYWETDGITANEVVPYEPTPEEITESGDCVIPDDPSLIAYHKYRVWLSGISAYPDRIYYCIDDIDGNTLYNYFTATSWIRSANPKGEGVTALMAFKEMLLIFTKTTVKRLVGDDLSDFAMIDYNTSVGTVSQRSVWNAGDYLIFLGVDGVYMCDGANAPFKVSQRIEETTRAISLLHRHRACAMLKDGKYFCSVPLSTVNNLTLMFDTDITPIEYIGEKYSYANSPWVLLDGFVPTQWIVRLNLNAYFSSVDGYVYQYGIGNTYNGLKIEDYYTTKYFDFGLPDRRKRIRRMNLDFDPHPGSFLHVYYKADHDDEWTFMAEVDVSTNDFRFVSFPTGKGPLCRKIAFKFASAYTGSRIRVNGFELDVAVHGQQRQVEKAG